MSEAKTSTGRTEPTQDIGNPSKAKESTTEPNNESGPKDTPRRRLRQRHKHRYETKDLIREISPQPDKVLTNGEGGDATNRAQDKSSPGKIVAKEILETNGQRIVQCNICQRRMTESRLANHIRLMHVSGPTNADGETKQQSGEKSKAFKCEYCGKSYAIKYTFDQHVKTHTEGRPKCPECGATFASAFSLFRHRAKSHNLEHNYTTHSCDKCDKTFFSISELTLHQQRHSSKKDHKCPECNKAFSVKGNLRIHMRTHAKEKLYKCDICDNSFSHPYSLVSHRRIHTNEFPYKCEECGKCKQSN